MLETAQKREKEMAETVKSKDLKIKEHEKEIDRLQGIIDDMQKQSSSSKTFSEA